MSKSKKQLCAEYKISYPTLIKWLAMVPDLEKSQKQIFTPNELEKIYKHIGKPT